MILPSADGKATDPTTADLCDYYYLCVWEHSFADGFGVDWNDRISSLENNQTPGTVSSFYNWTGSSWANVLDSWEFDQVSNLRYSARGNVNDIIDAVHVCTS